MSLDPFKLNTLLYSPDPAPAGDPPKEEEAADKEEKPTDEKKKVEFSPEQQAEVDRIVKERLERAKTKAEVEAKKAADKAAADATASTLKEKGEFEKLANAEKARADKVEAELNTLRSELSAMRMRSAFDATAAKLQIKFANDAAKADAFEKITLDEVGEDFGGMEAALKKLRKERPHWFETPEAENLDGKTRGAGGKQSVSEALVTAKRSQYGGQL